MRRQNLYDDPSRIVFGHNSLNGASHKSVIKDFLYANNIVRQKVREKKIRFVTEEKKFTIRPEKSRDWFAERSKFYFEHLKLKLVRFRYSAINQIPASNLEKLQDECRIHNYYALRKHEKYSTIIKVIENNSIIEIPLMKARDKKYEVFI